MTLHISVSPEAETKLREGAAAQGKDLTSYAGEVLERAARQASIETILAPLRQEFAASGTSDEQLIEQITESRQAYRSQS